jgi:hypothetical protein
MLLVYVPFDIIKHAVVFVSDKMVYAVNLLNLPRAEKVEEGGHHFGRTEAVIPLRVAV